MAAQQVLLGETVAGMKKAMKRTAYESDSDNEIEHYSNRGNKLKKRALFAHQGQLIPPTGPEVYKETVEYAGHEHPIINRNPPVLDDEGYQVESDDDPEDERVEYALASAAELNPYSDIRLEQLLAPLTASTDIPTHPTLSKPFTSETLTNLSDQSCAIMRKENQSLWRVKHLLTRLTGDHTWAPCEMMVGPSDAELFSDEAVAQSLLQQARARHGNEAMVNGAASLVLQNDKNETFAIAGNTDQADEAEEAEDESMSDTGTNGDEEEEPKTGADASVPKEPTENSTDESNKDVTGASTSDPMTNGDKSATANDTKEEPQAEASSKKGKAREGVEDGDVEMREGSPSQPQVGADQAMVNGGEALSIASQMIDELFIHPVFRAPPNAQPDRGGLTEGEAEEMRRLVASYVQKQEEICRGAHKLHDGLLKADRLRRRVLHWSKAEAHSGPNHDMSDGEDWYDKEEWGLTEDLKKGQDEEEEDTGTATKKTRNRRG